MLTVPSGLADGADKLAGHDWKGTQTAIGVSPRRNWLSASLTIGINGLGPNKSGG